MRIEYWIDPKRRRLRAHAMGGFHLFSFANYIERLFHDPLFDPKLDSLIIVQDEITMPGVQTTAAIIKLLAVWEERRKGARWAIVFPSEKCRLQAEAVLAKLGLKSIKARCFVSEAEAVAWLDSADDGRKPTETPRAVL
jgi:hypothetical protein